VLLVIVVAVGGRRLVRPVERVAAGPDPSPTAVAPAGPGTTTQPDGCAITSACTLPDAVTDFEVRSLPEGWSEDRTITGAPKQVPRYTQPLLDGGFIEHEFFAPVQDVQSPGGMAARYLRVLLMVGGRDRANIDTSRAPRIPLPGGRTAFVGDGSRTGGGVTFPSSIVVVDLDDRRWLMATGEGIRADVVLTAVSSIVIR
jgi:hypothetical protein